MRSFLPTNSFRRELCSSRRLDTHNSLRREIRSLRREIRSLRREFRSFQRELRSLRREL